MATPPKKPVDVQEAKRLLKSLEVTPVQTATGMSTYLKASAEALDAWIQSSSGLGAAPLRRHIALLEKSLAFHHHVQSWYKERDAEVHQLNLFSRFDTITTHLSDLKTESHLSNESPQVKTLQREVIFLFRHLEEMARELEHGTLRSLFYAADDDGIDAPVFKRKEDGRPAWPMNPFSAQSREHDYSNHIYGQWGFDPRIRYVPNRQNVATFRRWDRQFNPWGPKWRDWEMVLIQHCGLKSSQCEELELPQILAQLDRTPIENELQDATAFLDELASRTQRLEAFQMDEGEKIRYRKLMAAEVSDLLLKVHHLDRRNLYVTAQIYPGGMKFEKFCKQLIHQLGTENQGPYREEVQRLFVSIASVLVPWCGESAIEAKQSLEQKLAKPNDNSPTKNNPTGDYFPENVAQIFDKSEGTVRRWCRDKTKPCHNAYKTGKTWRVPHADIEVARP